MTRFAMIFALFLALLAGPVAADPASNVAIHTGDDGCDVKSRSVTIIGESGPVAVYCSDDPVVVGLFDKDINGVPTVQIGDLCGNDALADDLPTICSDDGV